MGRPRKPWLSQDERRMREWRRHHYSWRDIGFLLGRPGNTCRRHWIEILNGPSGWSVPRLTKRAI